jgi:hypothetical protein
MSQAPPKPLQRATSLPVPGANPVAAATAAATAAAAATGPSGAQPQQQEQQSDEPHVINGEQLLNVRIGGKFSIGRKIGSGAFGDIHIGAAESRLAFSFLFLFLLPSALSVFLVAYSRII